MIPPLILPEDALAVARGWRDECVNQWRIYKNPRAQLIGMEEVISPVDGQLRPVAMFISDEMPVAGLAFPPGTRTRNGEMIAPEGFFSVLIDREAPFTARTLLAAILHELAHVLDPCFIEDCRAKHAWPEEWKRDAYRLYRLPSEQRAFTAMWADEIRAWQREQAQFDPATFIRQMTDLSLQFRGFVIHNPDLHYQIIDHVSQIASAWSARPKAEQVDASEPTEPSTVGSLSPATEE